MTNSTPFEPGASLARIDRAASGYTIDCRSPRAARTYDFTCEGCAAEFAVALRDEGQWALRFGRGADVVRDLVTELDACAE